MKAGRLGFGLALIFPAALYLLSRLSLLPLGDTDRYYHLALSRILSEQGSLWLRALPQVHDVGWGNYFPDKEFLFHVFSSISFRLGGEGGVVLCCFLFALGVAWLLYAHALSLLPAWLAFLAVLPFVFNQIFVLRLLFLRPFVLAIFLFLVFNVALLKRRGGIAAVALALFALSYHAFYLPLASLFFFSAAAALEPRAERKALLRVALFSIVGLAAGLVLNPYFPSNVQAAFQQLYGNYLARHELSGVRFGQEVYPLAWPVLVQFYGLTFLVFPFAFLQLARARWRAGFELRFLLAQALLFLILTFQSARGGEYLVPVAGLLFVELWRNMDMPRIAQGIAGALAVLQISLLVHTVRAEARFQPDRAFDEQIRGAIAAIPPGGGKVFNCDWALGAYLLYLRPDLSFVDALDPLALYFHDRAKFALRESLRAGEQIAPRKALAEAFGANYVLCSSGLLEAQLGRDPGARLLNPGSAMHLFELSPRAHPAFVTALSVRALSIRDAQEARAFVPGRDPGDFMEARDFGEALPLQGNQAGLACFEIAVPLERVAAFAGATHLGIGGGPSMRAWRNGRLLFASGKGFPQPRALQALVPLDPPLRPRDSLRFLYCGQPGGPPMGVALSLWRKGELEGLCRARPGGGTGGACLLSPSQ